MNKYTVGFICLCAIGVIVWLYFQSRNRKNVDEEDLIDRDQVQGLVDVPMLITDALAFTIALSWNNAVTNSLQELTGGGAAGSWIVAVVVTSLVIISIIFVNQAYKKRHVAKARLRAVVRS